jgi:hypothetical protein
MPVGKAAAGHADVQTLGLNDGTTLTSRRPKHSHGMGTIAIAASGAHGHTFTGNADTTGAESAHTHGVGSFVASAPSHSLTLPNHIHSYTDPGHFHTFANTNNGGAGSNQPNNAIGGAAGATNTSATGITMGNPTTNPAISGSVNAPTITGTSAAGSSHTHAFTPVGTLSATDTHTHTTGNFTGSVGTTAAAPAEGPSYIVVNYIVKL